MKLLIAILLAAAVPLASGQTVIEKAKAEQSKKAAAAAKANDAKKNPKAKQSGGQKTNQVIRGQGEPPAQPLTKK